MSRARETDYGKGDDSRVEDRKRYAEEFDRIFSKKVKAPRCVTCYHDIEECVCGDEHASE